MAKKQRRYQHSTTTGRTRLSGRDRVFLLGLAEVLQRIVDALRKWCKG